MRPLSSGATGRQSSDSCADTTSGTFAQDLAPHVVRRDTEGPAADSRHIIPISLQSLVNKFLNLSGDYSRARRILEDDKARKLKTGLAMQKFKDGSLWITCQECKKLGEVIIALEQPSWLVPLDDETAARGHFESVWKRSNDCAKSVRNRSRSVH